MSEERPRLRLVRGAASPEELAALVAVLSAAAEDPEPAGPAPSQWCARDRGLRRALVPGRGAWRASAYPR